MFLKYEYGIFLYLVIKKNTEMWIKHDLIINVCGLSMLFII